MAPEDDVIYTYTASFNRDPNNARDKTYISSNFKCEYDKLYHDPSWGSDDYYDGYKYIFHLKVKLESTETATSGSVYALWDKREVARKEISFRKESLTITAKDQTYVYDGSVKGPGDEVYEDPDQIAEMVSAAGLQDGDHIAQIIVDGQAADVGEYSGALVPKSAVIKDADDNDVTRRYDISYVNGDIIINYAQSYDVTFKVVNGSWDDDTTIN